MKYANIQLTDVELLTAPISGPGGSSFNSLNRATPAPLHRMVRRISAKSTPTNTYETSVHTTRINRRQSNNTGDSPTDNGA